MYIAALSGASLRDIYFLTVSHQIAC